VKPTQVTGNLSNSIVNTKPASVNKVQLTIAQPEKPTVNLPNINSVKPTNQPNINSEKPSTAESRKPVRRRLFTPNSSQMNIAGIIQSHQFDCFYKNIMKINQQFNILNHEWYNIPIENPRNKDITLFHIAYEIERKKALPMKVLSRIISEYFGKLNQSVLNVATCFYESFTNYYLNEFINSRNVDS